MQTEEQVFGLKFDWTLIRVLRLPFQIKILILFVMLTKLNKSTFPRNVLASQNVFAHVSNT